MTRVDQFDLRREAEHLRNLVEAIGGPAIIEVADDLYERLRRSMEIAVAIGRVWRGADPNQMRDQLASALLADEMQALLEAITFAHFEGELAGKGDRVCALCAAALLASPGDRLVMRDHLRELLELSQPDFVLIASTCDGVADDPAWCRRHVAVLEEPARSQRMARLAGLGLVKDGGASLVGWLLLVAMGKVCG